MAKNSDVLPLLLVGGLAYLAWWSGRHKRKGSVEVGPLDQGSFGTDVAQPVTQVAQLDVMPVKRDSITMIGPFAVEYGNSMAGIGKFSKICG